VSLQLHAIKNQANVKNTKSLDFEDRGLSSQEYEERFGDVHSAGYVIAISSNLILSLWGQNLNEHKGTKKKKTPQTYFNGAGSRSSND
jgi:hypothetical protein